MLGDNTCSLLIDVIGENGTDLPTVGDSRYMLRKLPPVNPAVQTNSSSGLGSCLKVI